MPYNELEHYYSWTTISLATFLTTAKEELKHHFDEDAEHTLNQILGGAVITYVSRLEHALEKQQHKPWPGIETLSMRQEFNNFVDIRNCFAHDGGKLLVNRKERVTTFLSILKDGNVFDHKGMPIAPYFHIGSDGLIKLEIQSLARLSYLCKEMLVINGKMNRNLVQPEAGHSKLKS